MTPLVFAVYSIRYVLLILSAIVLAQAAADARSKNGRQAFGVLLDPRVYADYAAAQRFGLCESFEGPLTGGAVFLLKKQIGGRRNTYNLCSLLPLKGLGEISVRSQFAVALKSERNGYLRLTKSRAQIIVGKFGRALALGFVDRDIRLVNFCIRDAESGARLQRIVNTVDFDVPPRLVSAVIPAIDETFRFTLGSVRFVITSQGVGADNFIRPSEVEKFRVPLKSKAPIEFRMCSEPWVALVSVSTRSILLGVRTSE